MNNLKIYVVGPKLSGKSTVSVAIMSKLYELGADVTVEPDFGLDFNEVRSLANTKVQILEVEELSQLPSPEELKAKAEQVTEKVAAYLASPLPLPDKDRLLKAMSQTVERAVDSSEDETVDESNPWARMAPGILELAGVE